MSEEQEQAKISYPISDYVRKLLQEKLDEGLPDGILDLSSKYLYQGVMLDLCDWLAKFGDKIKVLNLGNNNMSSNGLSILLEKLKERKVIAKELILHASKLDDESMIALGEFIKINKYVESINIDCNKNISAKGIEILMQSLEENTILKDLSIKEIESVTNASIPLLIKAIKSSHIDYLDVKYTQISPNNVLVIPLSENTIKFGASYMDFTFIYRDINDGHIEEICNLMKKHNISRLKEISLGENTITSKGAIMLFETLKESETATVKTLLFNENVLDNSCMKSLGEYLKENEFLETLNLSLNDISSQGIKELSEHICGNTTLRSLNLYGNEDISSTSMPYLMEIIKKTCIINLNTWKTKITTQGRKEIEAALNIPFDKRELPIKSNTKSAAKVCSKSSSLT